MIKNFLTNKKALAALASAAILAAGSVTYAWFTDNVSTDAGFTMGVLNVVATPIDKDPIGFDPDSDYVGDYDLTRAFEPGMEDIVLGWNLKNEGSIPAIIHVGKVAAKFSVDLYVELEADGSFKSLSPTPVASIGADDLAALNVISYNMDWKVNTKQPLEWNQIRRTQLGFGADYAWFHAKGDKTDLYLMLNPGASIDVRGTLKLQGNAPGATLPIPGIVPDDFYNHMDNYFMGAVFALEDSTWLATQVIDGAMEDVLNTSFKNLKLFTEYIEPPITTFAFVPSPAAPTDSFESAAEFLAWFNNK